MGRVMEVHNLVDNKILTPLWTNPCGPHNVLSYGPQNGTGAKNCMAEKWAVTKLFT